MKLIGGYSLRTYTTMRYVVNDPPNSCLREIQIDFIPDILSESLCTNKKKTLIRDEYRRTFSSFRKS